MMTAMPGRSRRAVDALMDVDPDFVDLAKMLYGDGVDADELWRDVFAKRELTPEQQQARRQKMEARVGLASNYLGLTAGTAATASAVQGVRNARREAKGEAPKPPNARVQALKTRAGKLVPAKVSRQFTPVRLAGGALALQGANVGGDVVANRVLGRSAKETTSKASVNQLTRGALTRTRTAVQRTMAPTATRPAGPLAGGGPPKAGAPKVTGPQKPQAPLKPPGTVARTAAAATLTKPRTAAVVATGGGGTAYAARPRAGSTAGYYSPNTAAYAKADGDPGEVDVVWEGSFSKLDEDKHLAFGWASVVELGGKPVVDRQGDYIALDDIEKAAYDYVHRSRVGGDMHRRNGDAPHHVSDLVESIVFTDDKVAKMGLPEDFPRGWWVGYKIHDPDTWDLVKKGERTGFSIHGRGRREMVKSLDELVSR